MPLQPENDVETCVGCKRNFPATEVIFGLCGDCHADLAEIFNIRSEENHD